MVLWNPFIRVVRETPSSSLPRLKSNALIEYEEQSFAIMEGTYTAQDRTGYDDPLRYLENAPREWTLTRNVLQISRMKSKISCIPKPFDRSEIERQEFAGAILRELPRDGSVEVQPGLTLFRVSAPTAPVYGVSERNDWRSRPSHGSGRPKVARGFCQAASH